MSSLKADYLGLNELKIFKTVRDGLPADLPLPSNVLTVKEDVLYSWDFANSCVLSLNIKAARSKDGDNVTHQSLLPLTSVSFRPEFITVNENATLILIGGPLGVLIMELPMRYPPYGAFDHNKEVVYCKSYSLDERLLLCTESIEVRQARFHPGSSKTSHILVLTSDNTLRLYNVENGKAVNLRSYQIGVMPSGRFPGSKQSLSAALGEVGVDFDFGPPQLVLGPEKPDGQSRTKTLVWPVYVLIGVGNVYVINISLHGKSTQHAVLKGPITPNHYIKESADFCSLICLDSNPPMLCIGHAMGTIYHVIVLDMDHQEFEEMVAISEITAAMAKTELLFVEQVVLDLEVRHHKPVVTDFFRFVYLHKDEYAQSGKYYVSHSAGVHTVTVNGLQGLREYVNGDEQAQMTDFFNDASTVEYKICTRTDTSKANSIVGFALYYDPPSMLALLSDGNVVSLPVQLAPNYAAPLLVQPDDDVTTGGIAVDAASSSSSQILKTELDNSPMRVMLREPFEVKIQNMLKTSSNQYPILKLGNAGEPTARECYELMEKIGKLFRGVHFKTIHQVTSEILKRAKAVRMMLDHQLRTMDQLNVEKHMLQEKAESLAEKYEDIKDKQDLVTKRCERLLQLVSRKKSEPSDAERNFIEELGKQKEKMNAYVKSIEKLKMKVKYQKVQMENWKAMSKKNATGMTERHTETISANLKEMSQKIQAMVKDVHEYKERLCLK